MNQSGATTHPRAIELIAMLGLLPHPEGGHFVEIHRSMMTVTPSDGRSSRAALTTIYYLLTAGEASAWHRVASDEVWSYIEGDPLELHAANAGFAETSTSILGRHDDRTTPVRVIPADWWQSARTTGDYTLVACTVGPGFDYADFVMLRDVPSELEALNRRELLESI